MMKYLYLALFAVVSTVHLIDSYRDDGKRRARTKGFILPLILLFYISSAEKCSPVLVAALITSWLGDVLLMPKGTKWFVAGGISFLAAHILFVFAYTAYIDFGSVILYAVIPAAAVYIAASAVIIKSILPSTPKMMTAPMFAYLIANSVMNVFALMQLTSLPCAGSVIAYIGAVLFFISDCALFLTRYHTNKKLVFKNQFTVMLTYILGEFLITLGMIFLAA